MIALTLLAIELCMLYLLYKKYGIANGIVIVFLIIFFYCNSVVLDVLIFQNVSEGFGGAVKIYNNYAFSLTCISYFLFLFTYFISFYFLFKNLNLSSVYLFKVGNITILLYIILLLFFVVKNASLSRYDIKAEGNFVTQTLSMFIKLFYVFIIFHSSSKNRLVMLTLNLSFILYCIFSYEREPIVLLLLVLLFKFKNRINLLYVLPLGVIAVFALTYFKAFYVIVLTSGNITYFIDYIKDHPIILSNLDSLPSFTLIYDYLNGASIYDKNYFSYISSITDQLPVYFGSASKQVSYGQRASQYYVGGDYGVAFSMILESLLNLSFFGPILIAVISFQFYRYLCYQYGRFPELTNIIFTMFFLSFVRTELIVIIKVYIIPCVLFFFCLTFVTKIYNKNYNA